MLYYKRGQQQRAKTDQKAVYGKISMKLLREGRPDILVNRHENMILYD